MNDCNDTTTGDQPATVEDFANATFDPYPAEIVKAVPSNDEFGRRYLMLVRAGAIILTRTKPELMEMFRANEEVVQTLHDNLVDCQEYLAVLADGCDRAAMRILVAASAVELAEQDGAAA